MSCPLFEKTHTFFFQPKKKQEKKYHHHHPKNKKQREFPGVSSLPWFGWELPRQKAWGSAAGDERSHLTFAQFARWASVPGVGGRGKAGWWRCVYLTFIYIYIHTGVFLYLHILCLYIPINLVLGYENKSWLFFHTHIARKSKVGFGADTVFCFCWMVF